LDRRNVGTGASGSPGQRPLEGGKNKGRRGGRGCGELGYSLVKLGAKHTTPQTPKKPKQQNEGTRTVTEKRGECPKKRREGGEFGKHVIEALRIHLRYFP